MRPGSRARAEPGQLVVRRLAEQRDQLRPRRRRTGGSPPTCASGDDVHHQCRSWPPSPQPRRSNSVTVEQHPLPSGRSTQSCSRRIGSCQQTSGFVSSGCRAGRSAGACSAQPIAAGESGPVEEHAAPSTISGPPAPASSVDDVPLGDPFLVPRLWNCQSRGVSSAAHVTRFSSALSEKNAPWVQQPSWLALDRSRGSRGRRCTSSASTARLGRPGSRAPRRPDRRTPPTPGRSRARPRATPPPSRRSRYATRFALRAPEAVSFLFRGRAGLGRAGWDVTRAGPVSRPRRFRTHLPATRTHRAPQRTPATRTAGPTGSSTSAPPAGAGRRAASVRRRLSRRLGTPLGRANRARLPAPDAVAAVGSGFRAPDGFGADRREPRFGATRSDLVDSRPIAPTGESRRRAAAVARPSPATGRRVPVRRAPWRTAASRGSPPPQRVRPGSRSAAASRVSAPPGRIWSSRAPVGRLWTLASPASGPRSLSRASLASASPAPAAPGSAVPGFGPDDSRLPPARPGPGARPARAPVRRDPGRPARPPAHPPGRSGQPRIDLAEPRPGPAGRRGRAEVRRDQAGSRRVGGVDRAGAAPARRTRTRSPTPAPAAPARAFRLATEDATRHEAGETEHDEHEDEHDDDEPALLLQWGDLRRPDADRRGRRPRRLARLLPALVDLAVLRRARGRRRRDRHAGARPYPAPPARPRPRPAHGRRHGRHHHRADRPAGRLHPAGTDAVAAAPTLDR